jgi:hypothetical protein
MTVTIVIMFTEGKKRDELTKKGDFLVSICVFVPLK